MLQIRNRNNISVIYKNDVGTYFAHLYFNFCEFWLRAPPLEQTGPAHSSQPELWRHTLRTEIPECAEVFSHGDRGTAEFQFYS